jgi:cytochrome c2
MDWKSHDTVTVYSFGGAVAVLIGVVFWNYAQPEWKGYQEEFRELVTRKFGPARARQVPSGIQQVWVKELGRVDRCTTCHLGVDWKGLDSAPEPYRSHPKEILDQHPVAKYGCTLCHGGQGYATDTDAAHSVGNVNWGEPVLGGDLGKAYLLSNREALLQVNCNTCHRNDRETKGADYINNAKKLVDQKGCMACHTIGKRGGTVGPNLTYIGDQAPEQFDYSRMGGKPSVFGWHVAHFKDPKQMVRETVMPNFGFGSKEAQSLAMLVMSWKRTNLPMAYMPGVYIPEPQRTPEEMAKEQQMLTGEGAFFVKKTCFICHDVSSFGIESATKIGPDLAMAYSDVQSRFGRTLEDFLKAPTGTMAVVLSTQIHLTETEREEAIAKLRVAYQKKTEQDAKNKIAKK